MTAVNETLNGNTSIKNNHINLVYWLRKRAGMCSKTSTRWERKESKVSIRRKRFGHCLLPRPPQPSCNVQQTAAAAAAEETARAALQSSCGAARARRHRALFPDLSVDIYGGIIQTIFPGPPSHTPSFSRFLPPPPLFFFFYFLHLFLTINVHTFQDLPIPPFIDFYRLRLCALQDC